MKCFVYCLIDPRSDTIFYVGKSTIGKTEPRQYVNHGWKGKTSRPLVRLLRKLHQLSIVPYWEVLEESSHSTVDDAEMFWIASLRSAGAKLTNVSDGGERGSRGSKRSVSWRAEHSTRMTEIFSRPDVKNNRSISSIRAHNAHWKGLIWMSNHEKQRFEMAAKAKGLSIEDWARDVLLAAAPEKKEG